MHPLHWADCLKICTTGFILRSWVMCCYSCNNKSEDRYCVVFVPLLVSRCRAETERDGTCAETRFGFPAKRTSPFISAGVSVQSAAGSRGVRISSSNAGWTVSDTVHDSWLPPPFAFVPFTSPPVRFRVPSHSVSALPNVPRLS